MLRFSWVLYYLFLTSEGGVSVWLSPLEPPPVPRFTPSALKYVQLSRCAIAGSCLFSLLLLCFPTHHHDGASPEHLGNLLLSPQMKDRTPRGAGRPGRLTNHICPTGAASQVRIMQRWPVGLLILLSDSISPLPMLLCSTSSVRSQTVRNIFFQGCNNCWRKWLSWPHEFIDVKIPALACSVIVIVNCRMIKLHCAHYMPICTCSAVLSAACGVTSSLHPAKKTKKNREEKRLPL